MLTLLSMTALFALMVLLFLAIFGVKAPSLTGIVFLNNLTGKLNRSHGPGLALRVPWIETIAHEVSLLTKSVSFEDEFETGGKESVKLKVTFEYVPWYAYLANFVKFGGNNIDDCFKKMEEALKERLNSIATTVIESVPNRRAAMDQLGDIQKAIKLGFESSFDESGEIALQEYYGVNLLSVMLSGVEQPKELKEMIAKREAVKEENKIRNAKMKKTKDMAMAMVKANQKLIEEAKKNFPNDKEKWPTPINLEKAIQLVQINESIVKKEIKEFAIEKDTQQALAGVLGRFAAGLLKGKKNGP